MIARKKYKKKGLANDGKGVMMKTEVVIKEVKDHGFLHANGKN